MRQKFAGAPLREQLLLATPIAVALALVAVTFWLASKYVEPAPPKRFEIATASKDSPYWKIAVRYQAFMRRNGVDLVVRETAGSFENLALLKADRPVGGPPGPQAAILQGGIVGGDASGLLSIGRIAYEPVWIFYRGDTPMTRLADLKGRRILTGPSGGGTSFLATRLLAASGITAENSQLVAMELPKYVDELASGMADAGLLVLGADAQTVKRLFAVPDLHLMNLAQADAFSQRFPYLTRLELKQGVVDFGRNVPPVDTAMVATVAALVVRDDLHPALANLLAQAVVAEHAEPLVDANGQAPIFPRVGDTRTGDFPTSGDPEFALSEDARQVYKSGAPVLQRFLPFWLATLLDRMRVMLVPIIGVLLPAVRIGPMIYQWQVRRRLLYWYRELKKLERGIGTASPEVIAGKREAIEEIEAAVNEIPIPVMFANQHFDLRQHIDVVRRRLAGLASPHP